VIAARLGRRRSRLLGLVVIAAVVAMTSGLAVIDARQTPAFSASADVVTVGVSVRRGGRPVRDLRLGDFTLTDNGVPQSLASISYERLPIDLTVVLDVSGSVTGPVLEQLRRAIDDVRRSLQPRDRLRLVTLSTQVRRLVDFDAPAGAIDAAFAAVVPGGGSAVLDALAVALASGGTPDRRQLIILFTDGRDSSSISTPDTLLAVARGTSPTVNVVLATPARVPSDRIYTEIAAETGGTVVSLLPTDNLGDSLRGALDQFRASYVLAYIPTGVERVGAHTIDVRVNQPGLDVRARRGYLVR
jgi:VWFA-related protein